MSLTTTIELQEVRMAVVMGDNEIEIRFSSDIFPSNPEIYRKGRASEINNNIRSAVANEIRELHETLQFAICRDHIKVHMVIKPGISIHQQRIDLSDKLLNIFDKVFPEYGYARPQIPPE